MIKIFSLLLISTVFTFLNTYPIGKILQEIQSEFTEKIAQMDRAFEEKQDELDHEIKETLAAKNQVSAILLERMECKNPEMLEILCKLNAATSVQQVIELAQTQSISLPTNR